MKPIIFSTDMVKAILEGRKTQTRRVIKLQPGDDLFLKTRYQVSDILWVRETWCKVPYEYEHIRVGSADVCLPKYAYRADSETDYTGIWRSSIHMPKEAARLFLRVTDVREERVQDISEADCVEEGISHELAFLSTPGSLMVTNHLNWRGAYAELWNSLNKKRGYGWDKNPWVWVIEFERCDKPEV